jgi:uncharacterized RDD family membrane protein YckC
MANRTGGGVMAAIGVALMATIICGAIPFFIIGAVLLVAAIFVPGQVTGYLMKCRDCGFTQVLDHLGRP